MAKIEFLQPGQEPMTLNRDRRGQRGHRSSMEKSDLIKIVVVGILFLLCVGYGISWFFGGDDAKAEEPPQPVVATLAPLPSPAPAESPLEPAQIAATATMHAALNRPAAMNAPGAYPYFVGVVTYEPGCNVSNLGFTTAGLNGEPYYLYFQTPLDRDPFMQMIQLQGFVQEFEDCAHPVLMVQQVFWLDGQATPAPVAMVISGTEAITPTWGSLADYGLPTPDKNATPVYNPPAWTVTPYPTYTPYPSATPYIPPPRTEPTARPTYTPYPTYTPNPATVTPTPTATPQQASIYGRVVSVVGCPVSTLAIQPGPGQNYFLIFEGATLPQGDPTKYFALATGKIDVACSGQAIKANNITWYEPATATPTATPTNTATPTATTEPPTATPTETPTATTEPPLPETQPTEAG